MPSRLVEPLCKGFAGEPPAAYLPEQPHGGAQILDVGLVNRVGSDGWSEAQHEEDFLFILAPQGMD